MKLFIPPLKTKLMLLKPWTFSLHYEGRNRKLWDFMFAPPDMTKWPTMWKPGYSDARLVILSAGTELRVDRVYVRKGSESYDSVTFRGQVTRSPGVGPLHKVRFWVTLHDANTIEAKVIDS